MPRQHRDTSGRGYGASTATLGRISLPIPKVTETRMWSARPRGILLLLLQPQFPWRTTFTMQEEGLWMQNHLSHLLTDQLPPSILLCTEKCFSPLNEGIPLKAYNIHMLNPCSKQLTLPVTPVRAFFFMLSIFPNMFSPFSLPPIYGHLSVNF